LACRQSFMNVPFHGIRSYRVHSSPTHWSQSLARSVKHILSKICFNITLPPTSVSSQCYLSFWLFHRNPVCVFLLPMRITWPARLILLDFIILVLPTKQYKLWRSCSCSRLQPPITLSLFGPNILISTFFSNTLSQRSSLNIRDRFTPCRTAGKIIVPYDFLNPSGRTRPWGLLSLTEMSTRNIENNVSGE
jgi:hypothetical protein